MPSLYDLPLWLIAVICVGASITIGFAGFFRMQKVKIQLALTSFAAAMFGLMIFLIISMNYPLRGDFSVEPSAFVRQRALFQRLEAETNAPKVIARTSRPGT